MFFSSCHIIFDNIVNPFITTACFELRSTIVFSEWKTNIFTYLALSNEVSFNIIVLDCYFPSAQDADVQEGKALSLVQPHIVPTHSTAQWAHGLYASHLPTMELH